MEATFNDLNMEGYVGKRRLERAKVELKREHVLDAVIGGIDGSDLSASLFRGNLMSVRL